MSKFGACVSLGGRIGFGAALQQCHIVGSPVPLLFALDQDLWPDVERYSPSTILIYRTQIDGYDNPPNIYAVDPVAAANDWYGKCKPKWLLNKAHYYAPSNERNPHGAEQDAWIDLFDLRLMQLADVDGFKLALHGDSQGEPDYPQWQNYSASLAYAALRGDILTLHEPTDGAALALRYRDVHELVEPFAPGLKIAISECYGNLGASWPDYVRSFYAYDAEAMRDPYMIGFAAYQLGGAENWAEAIPQWADYVSTHPTPPAVEPPADEWVFTKVIINGAEFTAAEFDYTTLPGVNKLYFVFTKKTTGETCTVEVTCDPADQLYRIAQTPAGTTFRVGDVLHYKVT